MSRHGCTPACPSLEELNFFLRRGVVRPDLRNDAELEQLHWSTNRHGDWPEMRVFAFDHRMQLEAMAGYTLSKGGVFKDLCLQAALRVQNGQPGYGILCNDRIGRRALRGLAPKQDGVPAGDHSFKSRDRFNRHSHLVDTAFLCGGYLSRLVETGADGRGTRMGADLCRHYRA